MKPKQYNPNFYFNSKKDQKILAENETMLEALEELVEYGYLHGIPESLTFETLEQSLEWVLGLYQYYRDQENIFDVVDPKSIQDTEHLLNMTLLGVEHLPEFDDVTLRYFTSISLKHLTNRLLNLFMGLILVLERSFPEKSKYLKQRYIDLSESDEIDEPKNLINTLKKD